MDPSTKQMVAALRENSSTAQQALLLMYGGTNGQESFPFRAFDAPDSSTMDRLVRYVRKNGHVPTGYRKTLTKKLGRYAEELVAAGVDPSSKVIIHPPQAPERRLQRVARDLPLPEDVLTFRPFQRDGIAFLELCKGRGYIGDEMGLGKTVQALGWLAIHPEARPAVIVCPSHLKTNWHREAKRLLPEESIEVLSGGTANCSPSAEIVIINYEILSWGRSLCWIEELLQISPKAVIIDEAHFIKNYKAKRTKACKRLARKSPNLILLSGTPVDNNPPDIYGPANMIKPGCLGTWQRFASRHIVMYQGFPTGRYKNLEELHEKLKPIMIRRLKKDVVKELPPKERIIVPVDMENQMEYLAAESDFLGWLEGQDPKAAERAIAGGALVEMSVLRRIIIEQKMKAIFAWIDDFLETSNSKLIAFSHHVSTATALRERYLGESEIITGAQSGKQKQRAVDSFQSDKKTRLLICNIVAAGTGYTLTAAADCAHLELMSKPSLHLQAEDRIHRIGQTAKQVRSWFLIAANSIEEDLITMLDRKTQQQSQILDGKKVSRDNYLSTMLRNAQKRRAAE